MWLWGRVPTCRWLLPTRVRSGFGVRPDTRVGLKGLIGELRLAVLVETFCPLSSAISPCSVFLVTLEFGTQDSSGPPNQHGLKSKGISRGAGEGTILVANAVNPMQGSKCLSASAWLLLLSREREKVTAPPPPAQARLYSMEVLKGWDFCLPSITSVTLG